MVLVKNLGFEKRFYWARGFVEATIFFCTGNYNTRLNIETELNYGYKSKNN